MATDSTNARAKPARTRLVVARMVRATPVKGLGGGPAARPICQRSVVEKFFACPTRSAMNTCGGGSSSGSAQPTAQQNSQKPTNSPTEAIHQPIRGRPLRSPWTASASDPDAVCIWVAKAGDLIPSPASP